MKTIRIVTLALALVLIMSIIPAAVIADEEPANIALNATPIYTGYSHEDDSWNWHLANINDGDVYEVIKAPNGDYGCAGGYHSGFGGSMPEPQAIGLDFGSAQSFNTVVIYPVGTNTFPKDFEIQVSNDGENWTAVLTENDYQLVVKAAAEQTRGNCPQTFTFDTQNARFVRLYATEFDHDGANYAMKLKEIEVYNVTETVEGPANLALDAAVTSDSAHTDGPWMLENINDGDTVNMSTTTFDFGQFAGYHLGTGTPRDGGDDAHAYVQFAFDGEIDVNRVVIYPANEAHSWKNTDNDPNNGVCFPANFKIQVSDDGESWTDVVTKNNFAATAETIVLDFETVTTKNVRFYMYGLTDYAKISEIEIYNIVTETGDDNTVTETGDALTIAIAAVAAVSLAVLSVVANKRKISE